MNVSEFGKKFSCQAGILSLMKDLGEAMASGQDDCIMMGGGNPGCIPAFHDLMVQRLQKLAADPESCRRMTGIYCPPQGDPEFLASLARFLHNQYGWAVGPENICLTNGSQFAFFLLFNIFAGEYSGGRKKKIRLPLAPEYIGYADVGLVDAFFVSSRPKIEDLEEGLFKYRVDFDSIEIGEETGALCVSRPTNPTGNVLCDTEIEKLDQMARRAGVPLIIDNAYGLPFPGIIYVDAQPFWNENTIMCLSLSKLGLPATRTGIIVASPEIISILSGMNAIMTLAPTGLGAILARDLLDSGRIPEVCSTIIRPYYQTRAQAAVAAVRKYCEGLPVRIHTPEGSMFLWVWFKELPITSLELYERLKRRGVLVISGHYFFPGLESDPWRHKDECLRVTYSQDMEMVERGIRILGEEVRHAYEGQ